MVKKILDKIQNLSLRSKRIVALGVCIVLLIVAITMNSNLENSEAHALKENNGNVEVGVKDDEIIQSDTNIKNEENGVLKVENAEEYFATLRLNKLNERSEQQESFNEIIESDSVDESHVADAVAQIQKLEEVDALEDMAETIVSARGYSDVFVKIDNDFVYITVLAESMNENEASAIASTVSQETGVLIDDIILKGIY